MDVDLLRVDEQSSTGRVRVAVDAMGGDHAPEEVVAGSVDWARLNPDTDVLLVGDEPRIRPLLDGPLPANVKLCPGKRIDRHG